MEPDKSMNGRPSGRGMALLIIPMLVIESLIATAAIGGEKSTLAHIPLGSGAPNKVVRCMAQDARGFLWFGTTHGLLRYAGDAPLSYNFDPKDSSSLAADEVVSLADDLKGSLWVGTVGGGLNLIDEASGRISRIRGALSDDRESIRSICAGHEGSVWLGTGTGLKRMDPVTRAIESPVEDSQVPQGVNERVHSIAEAYSRNLWVGKDAFTIDRIGRDHKTVSHYQLDPSSKAGPRRDGGVMLQVSSRGEIWACTEAGRVAVYDPEADKFAPYGRGTAGKSGIDSATAFIVDRRSVLWIGSRNGVMSLDVRNQLSGNVLPGPASPASPGAGDVTAIMEDRSGLIWIATRQGGVEKLLPRGEALFDEAKAPEKIPSMPFVPPVAITAFMLYDNTNWNFVGKGESFDSVQISYKDNFFAFGFAALDYARPAANQYAFMLEGYDRDWVQVGNNRFARYTNVPPGTYLFRVKAAGSDRAWNEAGASMKIVITPPFWNTAWFYGLAAAGVFGCVLLLNRYRVEKQVRRITRAARLRAAENRRVRQKAADDFHDEFGHKLTKISLLSQVMKRRLAQNGGDKGGQLDKIIETSDELSTSMRDFLWALNPEKDSAGDIAVRLKDFGDGLFDGSGIAFRAHGTAGGIEEIPLAIDWRRHLLLIFKEAMNNAAKHSGCRNVTLDVTHDGGTFTVRLSDDGKGFDQHSPSSGQGIDGMKKRAEKIQGELTITSSGGKGTVITFSGKLPSGPGRERGNSID